MLSQPDLPMSFAERAYALHAEQRDEEALCLLDVALKSDPTLTGAAYLRHYRARARRLSDRLAAL